MKWEFRVIDNQTCSVVVQFWNVEREVGYTADSALRSGTNRVEPRHTGLKRFVDRERHPIVRQRVYMVRTHKNSTSANQVSYVLKCSTFLVNRCREEPQVRAPVVEVVHDPVAVEFKDVVRRPLEEPRQLGILPPEVTLHVAIAARVSDTDT